MNVNASIMAVLVASFIVTACTSLDRPKPVETVISNVTVIGPDTRSSNAGMDVFINEGRIAAIHPGGEGRDYAPDTIVDGTDQYLIPGLMDMHVHLAHPHFSANTLALLLANGVTGVREMSGDCWEPPGEIFACIDEYRQLQEAIRSGAVAGPRILRISSAIVRGPSERRAPHVPAGAAGYVTPGNASEAQRLVDYLADREVDFIKTYDGIPADAYSAILERAARHNLEVSGHVPLGVSAEAAVAAGHRTIEHARTLAYDCSRHGDELHRNVRNVLDGKSGALRPNEESKLRQAMTGFDAHRCQRLLTTLAEHGTWYVPTHETREMDARAGEEQYRADSRLKYVPSSLREMWRYDLERTANQPPGMIELYREFYEHGLKITAMAHAAGVRIMVGTDANDTMSIPGFGIHDEMQHLVRAGLAPMNVLRAATTVPADYLGMQEDFGGISVGRKADLVLLGENPLADIRNTTCISAVFFDGRLLERKALDAMLAECD